ncbi:MAG TPA: pullulanase-associated domain-containing protein [Anaeromyxobacteraceae bacterium]|nr:pullulanase-associated domain-containing protein [Anaeromyxobacteraceae bacterium]
MKTISRLLALGGLAAAFALGPAPAAAQDTVKVHYHRADGSYDGWGLHVWESFQKKEEAGDEWAAKEMTDRPLDGVTWFKPLKPAGKDDFGIYWEIPAKEFGNGRVNYIVHKGDKKDQCNKDMFWLIKDTKEAWVVSDDCSVHLSKESAMKSPKWK